MKKITYRGETLSITGWARRRGLPEPTFKARHKAGWTIAQLMGDEPPPLRKGQIKYKGEVLTIGEWAHRAGKMPKATFVHRMGNGWTMAQLLGEEPPPERKLPGYTNMSTPELRALARVRQNLDEARRELVEHGRVVERRVEALVREENRLAELIGVLGKEKRS